jgi:hypothetical protein
LKAVKRGNTVINPASNSITASPTELIEAEVFISNWSTSPTRRLISWQWALDTIGFTSGQRGSFDFARGRRACTDDTICGDLGETCGRTCISNIDCANLGTTCVSNRCSGWEGFCTIADDRANAVILDVAHVSPLNVPDYVFASCANIFATDLQGPRCGATLLSTGCAPLYAAPPKYSGTIKVRSTSDACGVFTISLLPPENTQLFDTGNVLIEPLTIQGLTINLGPCACTTIVSGQPGDCSIDPRQPSEPDGSNPAGPSSIVLTMDCDTGAAPVLACSNFFITQVPTGAPALSCFSVTPRFGGENEQILVTLNRRVTPQRWNCFEYQQAVGEPQGDKVCFNHFPGDVDFSRSVQPLDMDRLVGCFSVDPPSCPLAQCDLDRSGLCAAKDLLRLGDLENGGDLYVPQRGLSILDCP